MYVRKKEGKVIQAWELGAGSDKQSELEDSGAIIDCGDGTYELFTQESLSGEGAIAKIGDFFKVDNAGFPYPNAREWFIERHIHLSGDDYEQIPETLFAWDENDGDIPKPVQSLVDTGLLEIDWDSEYARYQAELWGQWETAACDAVIVFYDEETLDFNFVAHSEFELTYDVVG